LRDKQLSGKNGNNDVLNVITTILHVLIDVFNLGIRMLTAAQLRAARALLAIDQRELSRLSDVSLATIQRMEASEGTVRGVVESLTRVVEALGAAGVELIGDNMRSDGGGRGVRLRQPGASTTPPLNERSAP
jgi:hypothetical protein